MNILEMYIYLVRARRDWRTVLEGVPDEAGVRSVQEDTCLTIGPRSPKNKRSLFFP